MGYYGVMNEKRWILWVHGLILLIAIALQITVGAIAFVYRNQGTEVLDDAWDRVFRSDPRVILDLESFVSLCCKIAEFVRLKRCQLLCPGNGSLKHSALITTVMISSNVVDLSMC